MVGSRSTLLLFRNPLRTTYNGYFERKHSVAYSPKLKLVKLDTQQSSKQSCVFDCAYDAVYQYYQSSRELDFEQFDNESQYGLVSIFFAFADEQYPYLESAQRAGYTR